MVCFSYIYAISIAELTDIFVLSVEHWRILCFLYGAL